MKIELDRKYKIPVILAAVAAFFLIGFLLDKLTDNKFTVEKLAPGEVSYTEQVPSEQDIAKEEQKTEGKININKADAETLSELDGIGKGTADKIIKYRNDHNGFLSIEELVNISGIGESKFEAIKDYICTE